MGAPTQAGGTGCRWHIKIRERTVLGLVGAVGIDVKADAALGTLAWPHGRCCRPRPSPPC